MQPTEASGPSAGNNHHTFTPSTAPQLGQQFQRSVPTPHVQAYTETPSHHQYEQRLMPVLDARESARMSDRDQHQQRFPWTSSVQADGETVGQHGYQRHSNLAHNVQVQQRAPDQYQHQPSFQASTLSIDDGVPPGSSHAPGHSFQAPSSPAEQFSAPSRRRVGHGQSQHQQSSHPAFSRPSIQQNSQAAPFNFSEYHGCEMLDIPFEITLSIAGYLSKREFMRLRLTCKQLNEIFRPLVFRSVLLAPSAEVIERAKLIATHFPTFVKTIYITITNYTPMRKDQYEQRVGWRCTPRDRNVFERHLDTGYKAYCRLQEGQQEIMNSRELSMVLCLILAQASNIVRVVFTTAPPLTAITEGEMSDYCPFKDCTLSADHHSWLKVQPNTASDCNVSFLPSVFLALSTASKSIREIVTEPGLRLFDINVDSSSKTTCKFRDVPRWTTNLTKLAITLKFLTPSDEPIDANDTFLAMIRSATNLQCLLLRLKTEKTERARRHETNFVSFEDLFQDSKFPKLRNMFLEGAESQPHSLLRLCEYSPSLRSLALHNHKLPDLNSWYTVVQSLQDRFKAGKMDIFRPYISHQVGPVYYHDYGMLKQYLSNNGGNPFFSGAVQFHMDIQHQSQVFLDQERIYYDWFDGEFNSIRRYNR